MLVEVLLLISLFIPFVSTEISERDETVNFFGLVGALFSPKGDGDSGAGDTLFAVAFLVILCAGILLALVLAGLLPLSGPHSFVLTLFPANVLIYLGAGLLAWSHRPRNGMGALILLTGVWVFLGGAGNTDVSVLVWLGTLGSSLPLAGFVHLLLARRLRRSTPAARRVLLPLYGYGIAAVLVILFAARVLRPFFNWAPPEVAALQLLMFCGVPIAFALGALSGGIARTGELEELGVWLGRPGRPNRRSARPSRARSATPRSKFGSGWGPAAPTWI